MAGQIYYFQTPKIRKYGYFCFDSSDSKHKITTFMVKFFDQIHKTLKMNMLNANISIKKRYHAELSAPQKQEQ